LELVFLTVLRSSTEKSGLNLVNRLDRLTAGSGLKNGWQQAASSWQKAEEQLAGGSRRLAANLRTAGSGRLAAGRKLKNSWQEAAGGWQRT
jgi:hypothetical protein